MNATPYFIQDPPPAVALQIWRDSHTEDQLAEKIRAHLIAKREAEWGTAPFFGLTEVAGGPLAIVEYQP